MEMHFEMSRELPIASSDIIPKLLTGTRLQTSSIPVTRFTRNRDLCLLLLPKKKKKTGNSVLAARGSHSVRLQLACATEPNSHSLYNWTQHADILACETGPRFHNKHLSCLYLFRKCFLFFLKRRRKKKREKYLFKIQDYKITLYMTWGNKQKNKTKKVFLLNICACFASSSTASQIFQHSSFLGCPQSCWWLFWHFRWCSQSPHFSSGHKSLTLNCCTVSSLFSLSKNILKKLGRTTPKHKQTYIWLQPPQTCWCCHWIYVLVLPLNLCLKECLT